MKSLWLDRRTPPAVAPNSVEGSYDVVVVGAGLTGLVTALLFARAGCTVAVVEGRQVGAGNTGNTTAKISLLQGTRLSQIAKRHSPGILRHYVQANLEGQAWLLRYCEEHDVPVQAQPAFTYATNDRGRRAAEAEMDACVAAGLDARWEEDVELPFATEGAVRLDDQAQFDPMDLLEVVVEDLRGHGGTIFEQTRVHSVSRGEPSVVHTPAGDLRGRQVVIATAMPILDRGGFFARMKPQRSYALAFRTQTRAVHGMYLSANAPSRSLRNTPSEHGDLLLVGGNGHPTGRNTSPQRLVEDLRTWTEKHFEGAIHTHSWSAQDFDTVSGLPYVGPLIPGDERLLVAGGYAKWGMTNAVAAALTLTSEVLGGHTHWSQAMRSWSARELRGIGRAALFNGEVAIELARGWAMPLRKVGTDPALADDEGKVYYDGVQPTATCQIDGTTHRVSAICPHLGGIVRWNDAELSWDCPLHGSRFSSTGEVLDGPATSGLSPRK